MANETTTTTMNDNLYGVWAAWRAIWWRDDWGTPLPNDDTYVDAVNALMGR